MIFLNSSMYLRYSVNISPCKRAGPFIWTHLNLLYPRLFCAKFGWNWHSGFVEEDVKSLHPRQRRRTTDKFWWEKLTWALGSGELMRKNYTSTNKGSMCHVAYLQNKNKFGTTWGHLLKRGKKSFFEKRKFPYLYWSIDWGFPPYRQCLRTALTCIHLYALLSKMHYVKFDKNWFSGSEEESC